MAKLTDDHKEIIREKSAAGWSLKKIVAHLERRHAVTVSTVAVHKALKSTSSASPAARADVDVLKRRIAHHTKAIRAIERAMARGDMSSASLYLKLCNSLRNMVDTVCKYGNTDDKAEGVQTLADFLSQAFSR